MNDRKFTPDSWTRAADRMQSLSQYFGEGAITFQNAGKSGAGGRIAWFHPSRVDAAIHAQGSRISEEWYRVVGNMLEKLNSDAAKLDATGVNYKGVSNSSEYVVKRYWDYA